MRRSEQEILAIVYRRSGQIRMRRHALQILAGAMAVLVLSTAGPTLVRQLAVQKLNTTDQPTEEINRDETPGPGGLLEGVPLIPGIAPGGLLDLLGFGAIPPPPGTSSNTTIGSSGAQTSGTTGSLPAGSTSQNSAGSLDTTFGTGGKVTTDFGPKGGVGRAMAIQPDGRIVVAGTSGNSACGKGCSGADLRADFALARYNANGSLDTTFGTGGKVTTDFVSGDDFGYAVAIQPNGSILVAGSSSAQGDPEGYSSVAPADFALARYNANGSLDSTFGIAGKVTTDFGSGLNYDYGYAVAIQPNGSIVVAGRSSAEAPEQSPPADFALARYDVNGNLDLTFGTAGKVITDFGDVDSGEAVAIQPDGRIVVAGSSRVLWTAIVFALARYNTNGSLDTTFDGDGKVTTNFGGSAYAVAIQPDGRIVVGGNSNTGSGTDFALARYKANGGLDPTFGTGGKVTTNFGGDNFGNAVAIQPDGRIVMAGSSNTNFALVRYNANGSLDSTFGAAGKVITDLGNIFGEARAVALQPDGRIVAAGFTRTPNTFHFAVVRYQG